MTIGWQAIADQASDDGRSPDIHSPILVQSAEKPESTRNQPALELSADQDVDVEVGVVPEGSTEKQGLSWRYGLRYETEGGLLRLRLGGLFQYDGAFFQEGSDLSSADDDSEFRRARLVLEGALGKYGEFRIQYDFADKEGSESIDDLWASAKNLPWLGRVKLGHFKESFGLENLTSPRDTTFMELALPGAFLPGRNVGVALSNAVFDERATWALGLFRETSSDLDIDSDSVTFTGRLTGLPWYREDGNKLLHLGAGFSYRNLDESDFSYGQQPESQLAPEYLDTGGFVVEDLYLVNAELALVYGPFSFQSEYFYSNAQSDAGMDVEFDGLYAQASYFITGEHRPYKTGVGTFDKVIPRRNFFFGGAHGPGAWEIAIRYSQIDLNDANITGGKEHNITAAVNWYQNPNFRIVFNYVYGDIDSPSGDDKFHAFQGRLQMAF